MASSRLAAARTTIVRLNQRRGSIAERVRNAVPVVPDPLGRRLPLDPPDALERAKPGVQHAGPRRWCGATLAPSNAPSTEDVCGLFPWIKAGS